jgi:hypothetical protein
LKNGEDFNQSGKFAFSKDVQPKTLGVTLGEPDFGNNGIQIGDR